MAIDKIQVKEFAMPSATNTIANAQSNPYAGYAVRYFKANLNETGDVLELQRIETEALEGEDIVLLSKDNYLFMDQVIVVIRYLEKVAP